jgi:hypothetical protein
MIAVNLFDSDLHRPPGAMLQRVVYLQLGVDHLPIRGADLGRCRSSRSKRISAP